MMAIRENTCAQLCKLKKLLVAVLSVVFLVVSSLAPDITTISSMAAETTSVEELANVFPAGITLYSDSFPGLHVTYDTQESYVIKEGKNEVTLGISVTDKKLADLSIAALKTILGKVRIPTDDEKTSYSKSFVIGVSNSRYEDIVLKTGNVSLYNLVKSLNSNNSKETIRAYSSFFSKLSEVVRFMEKTESNPAGPDLPRSDEPNEPQERKENDGQDSEGANKELCNRTFLLYLCGADLESKDGVGTQDLLDLLRTKIPEGVKIYIVTGGSKKWHMNDPVVYRYYVERLLFPRIDDEDAEEDERIITPEDRIEIDNMANDLLSKYGTEISTGEITIWEVVNDGIQNRMVETKSFSGKYMTDPKFLSQIIDYVAPEDSERKYDLILWDHGGGYGGYGYDELLAEYKESHQQESGLPDPGFSLKQLREALAGSEFIKSGRKFDFIGFDACQMGNYEAVSALKELSYYYIGSEENEYGTGWDYQTLFSELDNNPKLGTSELGKKVVDAYVKKFEKDMLSCLSLVDLTKVDELDSAVSIFAENLLKEIEQTESAYYEVLNIVGKKSHFATRNGVDTSNYLDLKRFVTPFASDDSVFSKELKDAANNVLKNLDECVLYNRWLERDVQNGGLSIYFPLAAYYVMNIDNNGTVSYYETASEAVKIYETTGLNNEYKKVIARFALMNLAAKLIGDDWQTENIKNRDNLLATIRDSDAWKDEWKDYWKYLYEAASVNEDDPDDPTLMGFDKILNDRITKEDIIVTLPDKVDNAYNDSTTATIEINEPETVAVGESVKVKVTLFDSNDKYVGSIGNTCLYSETKEINDSKVTYSVAPYNSVWYLLNGQICSMYITKTNEDGSYQGYIPVSIWANAKSASTLEMKEGESRSDYLKRAAKEEKVTTLYLNIFSDEKGEKLSVDSYSIVQDFDGTVAAAKANMSYLEGGYFELLGGADDFYKTASTPALFSLGTIYKENNKAFDITTDYVDTGSYYYISDVYGKDYELTKETLGAEKGLDDFYSKPGTDENGNTIKYMTWEESLQKAEQVRAEAGEAAKDAENQAESTNNLNQSPAAAIRSMASSVDAKTITPDAESDEAVNVEDVAKAVEETGEKSAEETATEKAYEETVEKTSDEDSTETTSEETVEMTSDEASTEKTSEENVEKASDEASTETTSDENVEKTSEENAMKPETEEKSEETPEKTTDPTPEVLPSETTSVEPSDDDDSTTEQEDNTNKSVQEAQD